MFFQLLIFFFNYLDIYLSISLISLSLKQINCYRLNILPDSPGTPSPEGGCFAFGDGVLGVRGLFCTCAAPRPVFRMQSLDLVLQRAVEETVRAAASVKPFDDQEMFPL